MACKLTRYYPWETKACDLTYYYHVWVHHDNDETSGAFILVMSWWRAWHDL